MKDLPILPFSLTVKTHTVDIIANPLFVSQRSIKLIYLEILNLLFHINYILYLNHIIETSKYFLNI